MYFFFFFVKWVGARGEKKTAKARFSTVCYNIQTKTEAFVIITQVSLRTINGWITYFVIWNVVRPF